jgi:hypothetical protein
MFEEVISKCGKGLPIDRRLCTDGFIIRAQATIRTDGFFVRAGFAKACALRAQPRPICTDTQHPYKLNAVFRVNRTHCESDSNDGR